MIQLAESEAQILACFSVMSQLRPHLQEADFVTRIRQQMAGGYQLVMALDRDQVIGVAGFRASECLAWGKFLYIEDLVVQEAERSKHHGQILFQWLIDYANDHGCKQIHLDSGVQRFDAHRFYFRQRMSIAGYHFVLQLH